MPDVKPITPCLWFDTQAEEAANFYLGIFPNSRITATSRYPEGVPGRKAGAVMVVAFELNGQPFTGLNGGPNFRFNEAISFQVNCATQDEIDHYWERLGAGGDPRAQQCGWLKDRFGVSWQVVPANMGELLGAGRGKEAANRAAAAMLQMKKLDIAALERARDGA